MGVNPDHAVKVITLDVNDPAVIWAVDRALTRAAMLPKRKRASAVLADLRRYVEGGDDAA